MKLASNHNSPIFKSASKHTLETLSPCKQYVYSSTQHAKYEKVTQNTKSHAATAKPVWKTGYCLENLGHFLTTSKFCSVTASSSILFHVYKLWVFLDNVFLM